MKQVSDGAIISLNQWQATYSGAFRACHTTSRYNMVENSINNTNEATIKVRQKTTERKIGKTTFIVSTAFNDGKERDLFNILARLIQNDRTESVS
jgi:hypothetical protein